MPTYTYRCADCAHEYDAFQNMSAEPHSVCPECQGKLERVIGAGAGVVFKGSGFYVTDYRKDQGGSKSESGDSGASGGSAKSESGSSDSGKPAASSTAAPKSKSESSGGKSDS